MKRHWFRSMNGRIFDEISVRNACEITAGFSPDKFPEEYEKWLTDTVLPLGYIKEITPDDQTVHNAVLGGQRAVAMMMYRDIHQCTITEAKAVVDALDERYNHPDY